MFLPVIDILVIVLFFTAIIIIGIVSAKRIKNQEDFFLGGRKFGKLILTFAAFGQGTSSDSAVGVSRTVFVDGIVGVWSSLLFLFSTPLYWLTSPWYRRMRVMTMAEYFEERFESGRMAMLYVLMAIMGLMAFTALGISATSKTVLALTPKTVEELTVEELAEYQLGNELAAIESLDFSALDDAQKFRLQELRKKNPRVHFSHFDETFLVFTVCIIILIYGTLGGLTAAFITDMIQGIFIILLSVLLLPFAMYKVATLYGDGSIIGSMSVLHDRLPETAFEIFGSPNAIDFTWYFVVVISVMAMANTAVQPNQLVAIGSGKDEFAGRVGFVAGSFIKRIVTILWGFVALFAIVLYADALQNPDLLWGYMTLDLLGALGLGLVGLMIACLMAALMSSADMQMITASGLFTRGFYNKLMPGKSESHYLLIGRVFSILYMFLAALFATAFDDFLSLLKFTWGFFAVFAATFWMGLLWRKTSRMAAWVSIAAAALLFVVGPPLAPLLFPSLRSADSLLVKTEYRIIENQYRASLSDVEEAEEKGEILVQGESFVKSFQIPGKSVFWGQGIRYDDDGLPYGDGTLNLELLALSALGVPLESYPYALNETLRFSMRVVIPFGLILVISGLFPCRNSDQVKRFFVKMRLPVVADHEEDARRLEAAQKDLDFGREILMFPRSNWEIQKFRGVAAIGFFVCCGVTAMMIGFLYLLVNFGS